MTLPLRSPISVGLSRIFRFNRNRARRPLPLTQEGAMRNARPSSRTGIEEAFGIANGALVEVEGLFVVLTQSRILLFLSEETIANGDRFDLRPHEGPEGRFRSGH